MISLLDLLRSCARLPKIHSSWRSSPAQLLDPTPEFAEYVRICGGLTFSVVDGGTNREMAIKVFHAARLCAITNARPSIGHSPYHNYVDHIADRRAFSDALKRVQSYWDNFARMLEIDPYIHEYVLDCEKNDLTSFDYVEYAQLIPKIDVISPFVRWYGKGMQRSANEIGWSPYPWASKLPPSPLSTSLYTPSELGYMRETITRTLEWGQSTDSDDQIDVWLSMGCGSQRTIDKARDFNTDWEYDPIYAYQLGWEINNSWFGDRPDRFAPWNSVSRGIFYPCVFDPRVKNALAYFVSYCAGAQADKAMFHEAVKHL